MKLQDLALSRYRFCARTTLKDDEGFLWDKFKSHLVETVGQIGGLENTSQKAINPQTSRSGYFVPVITSQDNSVKKGESGVVFHNGFYRILISGIFLDVYVLQEWVGVAEQFTDLSRLSDAAEKLNSQIRNYAKIESELPAECFCHFTELPQPDSRAGEVLSTLLETENFSEVELDFAHLAVVFANDRAAAVVISKNFASAEAKQMATKLFDELLREYFLSFAKIAFEAQNINSLNAKSARRILSEYLDWLEKHRPHALRQIESANRDLTRYRVDLAEKVKTVEAHLHTMEINIGNAEKILDNPLLRQRKDELRRTLIKPLEIRAEQIKADLGYLKIDEEKARIFGEEIANLSNLQAGIWGRKLAWLFGLLSLVGVLQLFSAFQDWGNHRAKIAILAAVILAPVLILFGRDIKGRLFNRSRDEFRPTKSE